MQTIVFEALHEGVTPPRLGTAHAAAYDLRAHLIGRDIEIVGPGHKEPRWDDRTVRLNPGQWALIPLGFKARLPVGYEAQIRPRSGLALKQGVTVLNSPGTIDADYAGEWGVVLINHGNHAATIEHGDRIAQVGIHRVTEARWELGTVVRSTDRDGGFGSTGR